MWENAVSGKQLDSVRKETHVVSVMIEHLETDAIRDTKGQSSSLKVQAVEVEVLLGREAENRDKILEESLRIGHVIIGTSLAWDLAKSVYKLKDIDEATFVTFLLKPGQCRRPLRKPRETRFRSRASMQMLSKKGFELRRIRDSADIEDLCNVGNGEWGSANKPRKHMYMYTILISS